MAGALSVKAAQALAQIERDGLRKRERPIVTPQGTAVRIASQNDTSTALLNLCANNYLGLADHPRLVAAARQALDEYGFGMASVRFICGTQTLHRELETRLAAFLKTDDAILFSSCFDANGGIFETLLDAGDAVFSDALNHASIIDGIRLCKAQRYRYNNNDMADLETKLHQASDARHRLIVTDGVFSMDGIIADLPGICALAERYDALVMVDDSHAVGFMGARGAGTPDHWQLEARIAILSGTFGKALGGASGGYIAGPQPIVDLLRQRARPYLFSNSLAPPIVAATIEALRMVDEMAALRARLMENAVYFRARMQAAGFTLIAGEHPIIAVMTGDARRTQDLAAALEQRGVFVTAFSYPVVPRGQARIRVQVSAAHTTAQLDTAIDGFTAAGRELGVIA